MRLAVLDGPADVARAAAERLLERAAVRPGLLLALPTGRTPLPLYGELARRDPGALAQARGFNLDELCLPAGDPRSFAAYMRRHAWGRAGLDGTRFGIPRGDAPDLLAECRRYDEALAQAGPLDLALLGLGADGHVAYNLPGQVAEETHVVTLPEHVAEELGLPLAARPLRAVTMGLGPLRRARALLMLACGGGKAEAVRALVAGPAAPEWPCTLLREHPDFELLLDRAAAAHLA